MNRNDFFGFEDGDRDFPFYNDESFFSIKNKIILLFSLILFIFLSFGNIKFFNGQEQIIFFFVTFIPLLLLTQGNLSTFFRKPSLNDFRLIIICYLCYEIYYLAVYAFFSLINFKTTQATNMDLNFLILMTNILQIISEEIFRAFVFILLLYLLYKITNNRKISIIISSLVMLVLFGLLHYNTYPNIVQILFFQGFGSIFELFGYLKTKNLVVAILIHLIINFSGWLVLMVR